MAELSKAGKKAVLETRFNMHFIILVHIVRSSIVLMALLEPLRIMLRILHKWQKVRRYLVGKKTRSQWSIVEAEANSIGTDVLAMG